MLSEGIRGLRKQGGQQFAARIHVPGLHAALWQYAVAGSAGIVSGIFALVTVWLRPEWAPVFLVAAILPSIALVTGLRQLLLAVVILDIPFSLDVHLGYVDYLDRYGSIEGLNISVTTICLAVLYGLWLVEWLFKTGPSFRLVLRPCLSLAVYLAFVTVSIFIAYSRRLACYELFLLVQMCLLYIYVVNRVRTRQQVLFIVAMLLVGLSLESAVMIVVRVVGHSVALGPLVARISTGGRVGGTFGSPNDVSGFISLLLAPAFSLSLARSNLIYKALALATCGLGSVALVITLSRGGWVAAALSLSLLFLLAWRRERLWRMIPVVLISIALFGLFFGDRILARLEQDDRGAAYSRVTLMEIAFQMIADHPVLGVGANNFASVMVHHYILPRLSDAWSYTVHNKYMLVWSELGAGGLFAFVWFLIAALRRGWRCRTHDDHLLALLALGFVAAIAGQMVHMAVDLFNNRPQVQGLWLIAALLAAISLMGSEQQG